LSAPDDAGLEFALVGQRDDHLVGAVHHMGVGHDVAVGREDEAGANAARLLLLLLRIGPRRLARHAGQGLAKEAAEELLHLVVHAAALRAAPVRTFSSVRMFTTEGPTCSTRSVKSGSARDCAAAGCTGTSVAMAVSASAPASAMRPPFFEFHLQKHRWPFTKTRGETSRSKWGPICAAQGSAQRL
jgi:hypothetical protein